MEKSDFEGTLVMEKLAAVGEVDAFFDAVDSDDIDQVRRLLKRANVDSETIATVLAMVSDL